MERGAWGRELEPVARAGCQKRVGETGGGLKERGKPGNVHRRRNQPKPVGVISKPNARGDIFDRRNLQEFLGATGCDQVRLGRTKAGMGTTGLQDYGTTDYGTEDKKQGRGIKQLPAFGGRDFAPWAGGSYRELWGVGSDMLEELEVRRCENK